MTTPSSPAGPDPDRPVHGEPDASEPTSATPATAEAPTPDAVQAPFAPPAPSAPPMPDAAQPFFAPPAPDAAQAPFAPPMPEMPTSGMPTSGMPAFAAPVYEAPGQGMPAGPAPVWSAPGPGGYPGAPWPGAVPVAPKRSRAGLIVGVAVIVLVLLCGIGGVATFVAVSKSSDGGQAAAPGAGAGKASPSASTPPKPMSAADYQEILKEVDALMAPAWQQVSAATNRTSASAAATALAKAAKDSSMHLVDLTAPTEAAAGHAHLVKAFASAGNDFTDLALAVQGGAVCAGSSAVAQVTGSPAASEIREAVKAFGSSFTFGAWLPAAAAKQDRKLPNGTYVKKGNLNGSGEFTINNGGAESDVVVSLVPNGTKAAAATVYVTAGSTFKVKHVRDGSYQVFLATGADWDPGIGGFTRDCDLSKFTDPLDFKTTSRQYTTWEITLKKDAGGNASTDPVDPGDFPQ